VQGYTKKTSTPGIYPIHFIGSFLGEFGDVHKAALSDIIDFHFSRLMYLIIAFALCLICFVYYLYHMQDKTYFYFSLYLLLGCTALLYYNFFVSNSLPYQYYRFLKLFSIVFSSFVLCSSYCYLIGKNKLTLANNVLALLLLGLMAIKLLPKDMPVAMYMKTYFNFFEAGFIYQMHSELHEQNNQNLL